MTWLWILVSALILLMVAGGGKREDESRKKTESPHWIYHPHVISSDDYECSRCRARFRREAAACPKCGIRMSGKTVKDEEEWIEEEEDLEDLLDDD